MSVAIEIPKNERSAWESEQPPATGVFKAPVGPAVQSLHGELLQELALLVDLPYREARKKAIAAFERLYVRALLERCGENVSLSARVAGVDRVYLHRQIRRHKLRPPRQSTPKSVAPPPPVSSAPVEEREEVEAASEQPPTE